MLKVLKAMASDRQYEICDRTVLSSSQDRASFISSNAQGASSGSALSDSFAQALEETPTLLNQPVQQGSKDDELAGSLEDYRKEGNWADMYDEEANEDWKKALPETDTMLNKELFERDKEAVAYSRSLLLEGDTIVYITYPQSSKWFGPTGVETSIASFRVRSEALLKTDSKVFADLLGPTQQYRIQRRKKLAGSLPDGVKYVLDLTPPDEGDDAVELISELSCSPGVRLWYTSEQRMSIPQSLVGGDDNLTLAQRFELLSPVIKGGQTFHKRGRVITTNETHANDESTNKRSRILEDPSNDLEAAILKSIEESKCINQDGNLVGGYIDHRRRSSEKDLEYAINLSKALIHSKESIPREVPDYCPVRHRDGIVRLLQVIEGKDPTLDSAPKVWTLFALAKYFDCTSTVVDLILAWLMAHLNTQFIEVLPEATATIAQGLRNEMMARATFSILVSEEALSLACRRSGRLGADYNGMNQFGRVREDINEDLRTRIEYASKRFHERVNADFQTLSGMGMFWFRHLPEYQKIIRFEHDIVLHGRENEHFEEWHRTIRELVDHLRHYVRRRIIWAEIARLNPKQVSEANAQRKKEQYKPNALLRPFEKVYMELTVDERIFTRFFWEILRELSIRDDSLVPERDLTQVANATQRDLHISQGEFNCSIINAIRNRCFMPSEANAMDGGAPTPNEPATTKGSLFFSVDRFFKQAKDYIRKVCDQMLSTDGINFDIMLTDTLLCLGPQEYKYLPLWAGGDDDGTGGVFDEPIPVAVMGPSGPGPDFHTGYSTAGSAVSGSELGDGNDDYEIVSLLAGSLSVDTSVAVEDGFGDSIGDRRRVIADDDEIHSEVFLEDSTLYDEMRRKGKEKAIDRRGWVDATAGGLLSSGLSDTMEDMDMSDTSTEVNLDHEPAVGAEHTASVADAVAEGSGKDAEVDWDSEGEEDFDYGDDEEMNNA